MIKLYYLNNLRATILLFIILFVAQINAQACTSSESSGYSVSTKEVEHPNFPDAFYADRVLIGPVSRDMYVFIYANEDTIYGTYIIRQDLMNTITWKAAYYGIHAMNSPAINQNETILYYLRRHSLYTFIVTVNITNLEILEYK